MNMAFELAEMLLFMCVSAFQGVLIIDNTGMETVFLMTAVHSAGDLNVMICSYKMLTMCSYHIIGQVVTWSTF